MNNIAIATIINAGIANTMAIMLDIATTNTAIVDEKEPGTFRSTQSISRFNALNMNSISIKNKFSVEISVILTRNFLCLVLCFFNVLCVSMFQLLVFFKLILKLLPLKAATKLGQKFR